MNYITLINHFWVKDLEHSFTPNDIAVYFRLLERCNALGWKNPFNLAVDEMLLKLRLKTKDPFTTARNRLKQAGLIDFTNGDGRGRTTLYSLFNPETEEEQPPERGKKNTPLMPPLFPTLSPPLPPPGTPLLHKTKLNKTKKEANASGETSSVSCLMRDSPVASLPAFLLAWQDLQETRFVDVDLEHYHSSLLDWSDSNGEKKRDWVATIRGSIRRDQKEGKLVTTTRTANGARYNGQTGRGGGTGTAAPKNINDTITRQADVRL